MDSADQLKWFMTNGESKLYDSVIAKNKKFDEQKKEMFTVILKLKGITEIFYYDYDILKDTKAKDIVALKPSLEMLYKHKHSPNTYGFALCIIDDSNMFPYWISYPSFPKA